MNSFILGFLCFALGIVYIEIIDMIWQRKK